MYQFKDLTRLTTVATIFVGIYMVLDFLMSAAGLISPTEPGEIGIAEIFALGQVLALFGCFVVVGRWIYRASENAHAISGEMTISPGWSVGWYFVPFANLVKPLHAMREIWHASYRSGESYFERTPAMLGWWWALWLGNNVIGNISFQMASRKAADPQSLAMVNLLATAINIPLCIVLITIMRGIAGAQKGGVYEEVFA